MASRATGGTFAAFLISGAILGFGGGAFIGTQSEGDDAGTPNTSATAPADGQAGGDTGGSTDGASPEPTETDGDGALTIRADADAVKADERIDLSGSIDPPAEGVQLQLQRSVDGGDYENFPIDPWETNADGEFSGYVVSSRKGENSFRVVRVDDPSATSEPVVVTIS